ncbi:alpha-L-rhamnosidase [Nocardioides sp. TF02-7]|uniref:alpha-L-rhamnosidase n=1 Tax=Nocardioides sp. TF02-7 TaxID=2917724 RepID=UPI001F06F3F7|nr:alpha-L-rhamnosidase [Nocardioides sp. TF02-7]UMG93739.1 glycoside hydrolase family 78 protein [Nocardioides sp. TF02-7]
MPAVPVVPAVPARSSPPAALAAALAITTVAPVAAPAAAVEPAAPRLAAAAAPVAVGSLTTEHLDRPLGIDAEQPLLAWQLTGRPRGIVQSAYQVQVATTSDFAGELAWDSGRVASDRSAGVEYAGDALASATRYHWRVRVWDGAGRASSWSDPSWFETGLLAAEDWQAAWIAPGTERTGGSYLRGELALPDDVARARLYVSGRGSFERGPDGQGICCEQQFGLARGIYEAWINGERVSDTEIESTSVDTRVRALYRTYDVTELVGEGDNALGLMIGEDSDVLAQLAVTLADGTSHVLATDGTWRSTVGPVTRAHRFHGEKYDARREVDGWSEPGTDSAGWEQVRVTDEEPGTMAAAAFEPMEVVADHDPVAVTEPAPGVYVLDFGQNRSGWTRIDVDLPAGTEVSLKHGERLTDGRVDNGVIGAAQTNTYLAAGGRAVWEPSFVYAGFRWVEVTGLPHAPEPGDVVAREVHNAVAPTGSFDSDDSMLDRLHAADRQTQVNGLHAVPEDTPTREKRGWTADGHIAAEATINNYGMAAFYTNWSEEHVAAQRPDGRIPDIIPTEPSDPWENRSDPAWGASHYLIPLYVYQRYGDARLLTEQYPSLRAYVDYLGTTTEDHLVTDPAHRWGNDWLGVEQTDSTLFRSGFYYWALQTVALAAELTGRDDEAAELGDLAADVAAAINREFLDPVAASYGPSQFANAFPLTLGIVPDEHVDGVVETLVADVVDERGGHFTGGLPGIRYIPQALAMHGRSDVVLDVVRSTEHPGWGYMLEHGPGTIWEDWNGASSLNHPMFTSIDDWLYADVAGIRQRPGSVGYRRSVIDPQVTDEVRSGNATVATPYGDLSSSWRTVRGSVVQQVTVPPNTTATVHVSAGSPGWVLESGRPVAGRPGVVDVRRAGDDVLVEVGSGTYTFTVDRLGGLLRQARTAVVAARADLARPGVRPAARRVLRPALRQSLTAVDAALRAHRAGASGKAQARAARALGGLQLLLDRLGRQQRRGAVSAKAAAAVRADVRRAQTALTAAVAGRTKVAASIETDGLTAGTTSEVRLRLHKRRQGAAAAPGVPAGPAQRVDGADDQDAAEAAPGRSSGGREVRGVGAGDRAGWAHPQGDGDRPALRTRAPRPGRAPGAGRGSGGGRPALRHPGGGAGRDRGRGRRDDRQPLRPAGHRHGRGDRSPGGLGRPPDPLG